MDPPRSSGRLTRQMSSRLQMHAPSSIQVVPARATNDVATWNAAIPLLSPLDIVSAPRVWENSTVDQEITQQEEAAKPKAKAKAADEKTEEEIDRMTMTWQHPALPLYYDPVPGKAPVFLLPNCSALIN